MHPVSTPNGGVSFDKARLFLECKKIYADDLKPDLFLLPNIDDEIYPKKDYHRMFIGEILSIWEKK
ncbi:MAG: flavin reductase family protein, partial [Bacteroidales bacterium]|nr:flavin reductase family protein [Bacteroidales bacterium]